MIARLPVSGEGKPMNHAWGKFLIYFFAVFCTAVIVAYSTYENLYESFFIITGMLVISCGITGIFMYFSSEATKKIGRYCVIAALVVGASDCFGLIVHVLLTRELSIAKADTADKERIEDRDDKRKKAQNKEQIELLKAQTDFLAKQKDALRQDAIRIEAGRRARVPVSSGLTLQAPVASFSPSPETQEDAMGAPARAVVKPLTEIEVRHKYSGWLVAGAIFGAISSVLSGIILAGKWEWDRNGNGIPDGLELRFGDGPQPSVVQPQMTARSGSQEWVMMGDGRWQEIPRERKVGMAPPLTSAKLEDQNKPPASLPLGTIVPGQFGDFVVIERNGQHVLYPCKLRDDESPNAPRR
jgi:hypothetical protein